MGKKPALYVILALVVFSISSCSLPLLRTDGLKALEGQVRALWDARIKGNKDMIYEMADRDFKAQTSLQQFKRSGGMKYSGYTIKDVKVDKPGQEGFSLVIFETVKMGYPLTISIREKWVFQDGKWRLELSGKRTPFSSKE